ncbi:hypothetical protein D3C87_1299520 [compost metagenome]
MSAKKTGLPFNIFPFVGCKVRCLGQNFQYIICSYHTFKKGLPFSIVKNVIGIRIKVSNRVYCGLVGTIAAF